MKTQIIQLDKDDDYISVRDKMNWSQTRRILLIVHAGGTALNRPLELTLIKRHAGTLGAQIALVTVDPKLKLAARQVGILTFESLHRAQEVEWHAGAGGEIGLHSKNPRGLFNNLRTMVTAQHKDTKRLSIYRIILIVLAALALTALGIYLLPDAGHLITPRITCRSLPSPLSSYPAKQRQGFQGG